MAEDEGEAREPEPAAHEDVAARQPQPQPATAEEPSGTDETILSVHTAYRSNVLTATGKR